MQSRQIDLTINKMTKAQYNAITPNADEVYLITDDNGLTQSDVTTALGYTPVNPSSLATVATSGSYDDLTDKPYIPSGVVVDQTFDPTSTNAQSGVAINGAGFLTSSSLNGYATQSWVTSQGYTTNTGTVTSVNNIQPVNGNVTISIPTVPTNISAFTNDSGYITSSALTGYATQSWVGEQGYITGISSSDVTTALGYTPYNSSNPNGYTSNVGTVTSVNNVQPVNGNVTLSIPSVGNGTVTFTQGGVTKGSITMNQSGNATIDFDAGGSGGIQNTATGTDSVTILGTPTTFDYAMNIGLYSNVTEDDSMAIGQGAIVSGADSLGIGRDCNVSGDNSIQLGNGTLIDDNIFQVWNYPLLDYQDGLIPDARLSSNIARTSQIPSAVTESTVSGWGFTKNTGTVTSVNNIQPVNGNVIISIPDVSNFVTNSSLATTLGDYVKSSLENTTQGTTASIGYVSGFAPVMQLTYGNYQMLCGCGEGAFLSMIDTTTNTQTAISAIPAGIAIKQGQQQALLSLSNNNLLVNGSELATQTWVGQQGYITGINSSDVTTALGYTPVDIDMSNISTEGKIAITNIGYPTTTSRTLSLQSSGSSYTAPADGWVHITLALNVDGYVSVNGVYSQGGTANGAYSSVFYPVSKGETFTVAYANRASTPRFRFYYAKGTESEAS